MSVRAPLTIPVEVLRTAVVVDELQTFSKAAARLGISQPAVSAQMKRLQELVGGEIFERDVGGSVPTSLGRNVIALARKVLEAHDQILRLCASDLGPDRIRLGITPLLMARFMIGENSANALANVFVQSENSFALARGIIDGRLDIACCFVLDKFASELEPFLVAQTEDRLVWVRSSKFVVSPGQPIPIVTWQGHDWMAQVLLKQGLSYQIVFDGEDFEAKRAFVEGGLALAALPSRLVPSTLVKATEYYLPELPTIRSAIYVRSKSDSPKVQALRDQLVTLFFSQPV